MLKKIMVHFLIIKVSGFQKKRINPKLHDLYG